MLHLLWSLERCLSEVAVAGAGVRYNQPREPHHLLVLILARVCLHPQHLPHPPTKVTKGSPLNARVRQDAPTILHHYNLAECPARHHSQPESL